MAIFSGDKQTWGSSDGSAMPIILMENVEKMLGINVRLQLYVGFCITHKDISTWYAAFEISFLH